MKTFVRLMAALSIISILLTGCTHDKRKEPIAKYIFLFIGDGMGHGQVSTAESYLSYKADKYGGERLSFTQFPYLAMAETHSADRHITCSAAGGTAIACGVKANNGSIGLDQNYNPVKSIAKILHEDGYNVGIMSSVPANHATPASFYANNRDRGDYYTISQAIPESGFEFIAGAGLYDSKGRDGDLLPIEEYIEDRGYEVCYGIEEFNMVKDSTENIVFLQYSTKDGDIDYYFSDDLEKGDIYLSEMLTICMEHLGDEEPFFIMCEGGEIDWSAHSNQVMAMISDIMEFDDAVKVALDFYRKHPEETLIIVTADHETGGVSLGEGRDWREEYIGWKELEDHWESCGHTNTLSYEDNKAMNTRALIGWSSQHHTGAPVPVYAIGKGGEKFMGRMDNTEFKGKILGE